jgi:antitoxin component YwqK of YwqJK toxin-antitoxin module
MRFFVLFPVLIVLGGCSKPEPVDQKDQADQTVNMKSPKGSLEESIVGKVITFGLKGAERQVQMKFNANGVMLVGQDGNLQDEVLTYQIKGNEVLVYDGERRGGILFSSSTPKAGDQVEVGRKDDKEKVTIINIEKEDQKEQRELPKSLSDAEVERLLKEAADFASLEERGGLYYQTNESEPFSGWTKRIGQGRLQVRGFRRTGEHVEVLAQFKDGKQDGLYLGWHENGQKSAELIFKNGKPDGLATEWHENGQKGAEATYKYDKMYGLSTAWHENGQKSAEVTFKGGKPDGRALGWHENGQKEREETFRYGKELSAKYWNSKGEPVDSEEEAFK